MRILVDIRHLTNPHQSGVGEYTRNLLGALFEINQNNEYILFSSGTAKPNIAFPNKNVRMIHIPIPNKLMNLSMLATSRPFLTSYIKEPIDSVFLPNLNIISIPLKIPTVLTIHDLSWHFFPECYSKKMLWWHAATKPRALVAQCTHLIVPSESTKRDLKTVFEKNDDDISVIPHGIDPLFNIHKQARDHGVRSRLKLPKRFVLFIGTIEPRKNVHALVEAVKKYRQHSRDDVHLVLAGKWGWRSEELKKRLHKKDVSGWIHELDYINAEDRAALYRSATALTWPSLYEGFGLPILEAMACGTPIITSYTSSLPELTQDSALLIDPFNVNDLADALMGLLRSQALQQRCREKGLARARQFSWEQAARQTLAILEK